MLLKICCHIATRIFVACKRAMSLTKDHFFLYNLGTDANVGCSVILDCLLNLKIIFKTYDGLNVTIRNWTYSKTPYYIYIYVCVSTRTLVHHLMHWLYEKYFIVTPMWMAIRKIYSLSDMSRSTQIISFLACRYEVGFVMA